MSIHELDIRSPEDLTPGAHAAIDELLHPPVEAPEVYPTTLTLPGGWLDPSANFCRDAEVRELTGADEEAISRVVVKGGDQSALNWMNKIVELGVVSIGGQKPDAKGIRRLLTGDRDALFLAIRKATYGTDYETTLLCPMCGRESGVVFELDEDVKTKVIEDGDQLWRKVNLRHGRVAEVRLVTVEDQYAAFAEAAWTEPERNTVLLATCVRSINGRPILGQQDMRAMGSADRKTLLDYLMNNQPGPMLGEVVAECPKCNQESTITLSMAAMFS
jgi:hypothetical protein